MNRENYDEINSNKGIGLPAEHYVATLRNTEHHEPQLGAQEFIQKQAKDTIYRQASSTVELQGSSFS